MSDEDTAHEPVRASVSRYTEFHGVVLETLHEQLPYLEKTLLADVGHHVLDALACEFGETLPARGRADF